MINGIVLRKIDYKETSYILNILTEDGYETLFNNGVYKNQSFVETPIPTKSTNLSLNFE